MVVAGGFLKSRVDETSAVRPVSRRKLLYSSMQISSWSPMMVLLQRQMLSNKNRHYWKCQCFFFLSACIVQSQYMQKIIKVK